MELSHKMLMAGLRDRAIDGDVDAEYQKFKEHHRREKLAGYLRSAARYQRSLGESPPPSPDAEIQTHSDAP